MQIHHEGSGSPLLTDLPVAYYLTDENGVITYYSEEVIKLWGHRPRLNDPEELRFCGGEKLFLPDGTPLAHDQSAMAMALKFKKTFRAQEINIKRPDGSYVSVLANINPMFTDEGELIGAINIFYEITKQKQAEMGSWHLAALVESSNDAIVSKTLSGVITSWNKAAYKMFGYTEKEILGKNIRIIIPQKRQKEEDLILKKIINGEKIESFESVRVAKNGKEIPVSLTISPIRNSSKEIIGASKIARDITEQVEAREKLNRYNEELEQLNLFKDEFIAMASHELKTPLAIIKANLQYLELNKDAEEKWDTLMNKSISQVNRLNGLVSDMLDISRMTAGTFNLTFTFFDVDHLIEECIENIYLVKKSHTIEKSGELDHLTILADVTRLRQVILNLLSNAIKYSPEEDRVMIKTELKTDHFIIGVTDFGPGISAKDQSKIFDMFYRSKETHLYPGLGIGLYLSQQIIGAHQGHLWVESEPGKGSTFYISLPLNGH